MVIGDLSPNYRDNLRNEINSSVLNNQTLLPHYIYNRLCNNRQIKLPSNIISSPTHIDLIIRATTNTIKNNIKGVFHIAGSESISRYYFAKKIAHYHGLDKNLIIKDRSKVSEIRPKNVSMNVDESYKILAFSKQEWHVNALLNKIKWENIKLGNT